jgi:DNA-binding response OmpR family regulator
VREFGLTGPAGPDVARHERIDVCRKLRADSGVPIVMLTAKTDTVDVVLGLSLRRRLA